MAKLYAREMERTWPWVTVLAWWFHVWHGYGYHSTERADAHYWVFPPHASKEWGDSSG